MLVTTWKALAGSQRSNAKAVASCQQQATVPKGVWGENIANESITSAQEVFSFIASKCFLNVDPTNPEEVNDFLRYMREMRKVVVVDTHDKLGSLIITVQCSSLEILEGLWEDYRTGFLNASAQDYLVTEHILKEFGLIEVKLKTTILENEYRACRDYFLLKPGENERLYQFFFLSPFFFSWAASFLTFLFVDKTNKMFSHLALER